MASQLRNIGIFAHVDAGKTTLSEQLLTHAGVLRKAGSVDAGTARTDDLPIEQRRGISVKATCVRLTWKDIAINLIDTPGHVDFSAEVERSLWALDAAVLVICGVEGVQPQTETLFHALKEQRIPTLIFINKMDREGADRSAAMKQIRRLLSPCAVPMDDPDAMLEALCDLDEQLLERYFAGDIPQESQLLDKLREYSLRGEAHPVLTGSALRDEGIEKLLDAIVRYLPPPKTVADKLCGVVFAAAQDRMLGRGVWVRLYGGSLENRTAVDLPAGVDPLSGEERWVQKKITQIRTVDGADAGTLRAGESAVVYGLGDIRIGQVIGSAD